MLGRHLVASDCTVADLRVIALAGSVVSATDGVNAATRGAVTDSRVARNDAIAYHKTVGVDPTTIRTAVATGIFVTGYLVSSHRAPVEGKCAPYGKAATPGQRVRLRRIIGRLSF